jgi:hypothetical protein
MWSHKQMCAADMADEGREGVKREVYPDADRLTDPQ